MANSILTSSLIAKEAAAIWRVENSFISTANRQYEGMFEGGVYKPGDTINVRLDNAFVGARGDLVSAEDIVEESIPVTIQPLYSVPVTFRPTDLTRKFENFSEEVLVPAVRRLATMVNKDIFNAALTQLPNFVGSPTANINTYSALDQVTPLMQELAIDPDYMKYASLAPYEAHQLRSASTLQNSFVAPLNKDITMRSSMGHLAGFDLFQDQSVNLFRAGTHSDSGSGVTVKTAVTTGNSITLTGLTNGTTFVPGDVFEVAGVYKFNPVTRDASSYKAQFVVTTGGTVASNEVTLIVGPAISFSGPRQKFYSASNNIPAGAAVTLFGDHVPNIAYSKRALIACMPPLDPMDSPESSVATDKDYGISVRVSKVADVLGNRNIMRLDVQCAYRWVEDQAVRLISKGDQ